MSWLKLFWGWRGRLNQLQFFLGFMLCCVAASALELLWASIVSPGGVSHVLTESLRAPAWLSYLIAPLLFSLIFRRAHDLGFSGFVTLAYFAVFFAWAGLLWLWPALEGSILQIAFVIPMTLTAFWFMLKSGQAGDNRFGPPPRAGWLP